MTGGFAYILDEYEKFEARLNPELVDMVPMKELQILKEHLRGIISNHQAETGSERAEMILEDFISISDLFKLVKPKGMRVEDLLGKRGRSATELLKTTQ